jgi:ribose transport system ATP-binding protein
MWLAVQKVVVSIENPAPKRHSERRARQQGARLAPDPKTAGQTALVSNLSRGNQQKVVIGKWLNHGAKLFISDEPTVGVDVGAKAEAYRLLSSLLKAGAGISMISSYLPEVYELADTLLQRGRGGKPQPSRRRDASHETILSEAIGARGRETNHE